MKTDNDFARLTAEKIKEGISPREYDTTIKGTLLFMIAADKRELGHITASTRNAITANGYKLKNGKLI